MAINNARKQWEVMQGSMMGKTNRLVRDAASDSSRLVRDAMPELVANHVGTYPNEIVIDSTQENGYERETVR